MKYYNWTKEQEANNVLRGVYGAHSVVTQKPDWGEGAGQVQPLPQSVHEAMLKQPHLGEIAPDDGGLAQKLSDKQQKYTSAKRLAWQEKLRARGIIK
jgi:hypothetical protein